MDETKIDVTPESSPEKVGSEGEQPKDGASEGEKTPAPAPKDGEKTVPYDRFKAVNDELARLKKQPATAKPALEVEDFIDISASLEGLDPREKEKLAREHKLTGKPLSEIRKDEDFLLWQSAYKAKTEKERLTLKPNGTQSDAEAPTTFLKKLAGASLADKEKMLTEAGLYKTPKPYRADRTNIGGTRQ